jgi:hypothetical protein
MMRLAATDKKGPAALPWGRECRAARVGRGTARRGQGKGVVNDPALESSVWHVRASAVSGAIITAYRRGATTPEAQLAA